MSAHNSKCPRCGKLSAEYEENKWRCLYCDKKFVYKEELPPSQVKANVYIEGSSLFDIEPYDPANGTPLKEPYAGRYPLNRDSKLKNLNALAQRWWVSRLSLLLVVVVPLALFTLFILPDEPVAPLVLVCYCLLLIAGLFILLFTSTRDDILRKAESRIVYLNKKLATVGWINFCPFCSFGHSEFFFNEKVPPPGPVHCKECGKQFMLLEGKAHVIKR